MLGKTEVLIPLVSPSIFLTPTPTPGTVLLKPMSFGIGTFQIYVSANLKITACNGFWDHL